MAPDGDLARGLDGDRTRRPDLSAGAFLKHSSETSHGLISFFVNELPDLYKYYRAAEKPFRGLLRTKPLKKLNF